MSINDAIPAYVRLMCTVFSGSESKSKPALVGKTTAFRTSRLEKELKAIVKEVTGNEEEKMVEGADDIACKVVVYAMSAYHVQAHLPREFRTYPASPNALVECTIWEALRATTTHPEFFKEIKVGRQGEQERFVQGGLGCSNPVIFLSEEAREVFPNRRVASIISIGAGFAKTIQVSEMSRLERVFGLSGVSMAKVLRAAYQMAQDNEGVAESMSRQSADKEFEYLRLNVTQGMQDIDAGESDKMDEVSAHTRSYLSQFETRAKLGRVVDAIELRKATLEIYPIIGRSAPLLKINRGGVTPGHCPSPNIIFVGRRKAIRKISRFFSDKSRRRRVFAIYGSSGVGKTQLALKYVERMGQRFKDVIFLDASSHKRIESTLASFASTRHLGNSYQDTIRWLETQPGDCLVVFDHADDICVGLEDYFPRDSECDILITTCLEEVTRLAHGPSARYRTTELKPNEAKDLLLRHAGVRKRDLKRERAVLHELRELLKARTQFDLRYYALAIAQAGALILVAKLSIAQYRALFTEQKRVTYDTEGAPPTTDEFEQAANAACELSFARLSLRASRLLLVLTFLHPNGISEEMFQPALVNARAYIPTRHATTVWDSTRREMIEILNTFENSSGVWQDALFLNCIAELVSHSWLTFDRANQTYSIQPSAQHWVRQMVLGSGRASTIDTTAWAHVISSIFDATAAGALGRTMLQRVNLVVGHIADAGQNYSHVNASARHAAHSPSLYSRTNIPNHWRPPWLENPEELTRMAELASSHIQQGQFQQAEKLLLPVLAARKQLFGNEHPETLAAMANLASTYTQQGHLTVAVELGTQLLTLRRRTLGTTHLDTLRSMANLAVTHNKQGSFEAARALEEPVLVIRQNILGCTHPSTVLSMHNLAYTYYQLGRRAACYELIEKAAKIEALPRLRILNS